MMPFEDESDPPEAGARASSPPRAKADPFRDFDDDDVRAWVGGTTFARGLSYQGRGRVEDLARTSDGGLVAWVQGTRRYATLVEVEDDHLTSTCTCPVGFACKHAAAVVLEYQGRSRVDEVLPEADRDDRRLLLLEADDADAEDAWGEDEDEDEAAATGRRAPPVEARSGSRTGTLRSFLEGHTKAQLVELIEGLAASHPDVRQTLQDRVDLAGGAASTLIKGIHRELARFDGQPRWRGRWGDEYESESTNFFRVRQRLEALLAQGHADEVVALGKEILETGGRQVELSDEGEGSEEVRACMAVVYRALPRSSLSPAEQLLWAVEAELADGYNLIESDPVAEFWDLERAQADWSAVADTLARRLGASGPASGDDSYYGNYRRDRLVNSLIAALENAGRPDEIITLAEREAVATGSYVRLVNRLVAAGGHGDAEEWIRKGVIAIQRAQPGTADQLRGILRGMREQEGDWPAIAAMRADDFFRQPSLGTYRAFQESAERAAVWPAVRTAALTFLETGRPPTTLTKAASGPGVRDSSPDWPLPSPGVGEPLDAQAAHAPLADVLAQIAIHERRPDDALDWYDRRRADPYGYGYGWAGSLDDQVADAVAATHPDRAIGIWKKRAEVLIDQTNVSAYESAAVYLRKVRDLLRTLDRDDEWNEYLAALRQANKRKWRLVEILDRLAGRPITAE
jgi:uncharacterized Zn finger protein